MRAPAGRGVHGPNAAYRRGHGEVRGARGAAGGQDRHAAGAPAAQVAATLNRPLAAPGDAAHVRHVPIRYEIRPGLVHVVIDDVLDAGEIFAFYGALGRDPGFRPGTPFLVDARAVDRVAPLTELRGTALEARRNPVFAVPTKSAALVATPLMFGVVRQWAMLSADSNLVTRPFYDVVEAQEWLARPITDADGEDG
jgi:hypothetical protein